MKFIYLRFLSLIVGANIVLMLFSGCGQSNKEDYPAWHNPIVQPLTDAIKLDPGNSDLYYQRSQALFQINSVELAAKDLKKAYSLNSGKLQYLFALAKVNLVLEQPDSALANLKMLESLTSQTEPALLLEAQAYLLKKDFKSAQNSLAIILQKDSTYPGALYQLANIYLNQQQTLSAIELLKKAIEIDPQDYDAHFLLADCYADMGSEEAVKYYRNTFKLDTTDVSPLLEIGEFYEGQNRINEAKKIYYETLWRDPGYTPVLISIGRVLIEEDSVQKALRQFNIAIRTAPNNADAYYYKGVCFEKLKQKDSAMAFYRQAAVFARNDQKIADALKRLNNQ